MADKDRLSKTTAESAYAHEVSARGDATVGSLIRAIAEFIGESLTLLALEGRRAILSLIVMLAVGVVAAVLAISAWVFLMAALAVQLAESGWTWEAVLLGISAANAIVAVICALVIRRLSHNLLFTATRRNVWPNKTDSANHA